MDNFYALLGLSPDATTDEIRLAYRRLSMVHHPDRGGNPVVFQQLQQVYETLADPERRAAYDATLRPETTTASPRAESGVSHEQHHDSLEPIKHLASAGSALFETTSRAARTLTGRAAGGRRRSILAAAWITTMVLAVVLIYFLLVETTGLVLLLVVVLAVVYWLYWQLSETEDK